MTGRTDITIVVTGHPVAKGRPRFARGGIAFTPKKTRRWEDDARLMARQAMGAAKPLTGPIRCTVRAYFVPSASWPAWKRDAALSGRLMHTAKPDGDNLQKAAKDAMNGVVWLDDAQVVESLAVKAYSEVPRVEVEVMQLDGAVCQVTRRDQLEGVA